MELGFAHEEGTEKCKKYHNNHEAEALVRRPAVAVAHDLSDIGVQFFYIVETFSDTIHDLINILAVV
jgi:hypothetical protein